MRDAADTDPGPAAAPTSRGGRTRQALLDSTLDLLASRGYGATTVQAVLDDTGLSRGSLLHQFRTRDQLMLAATEEALRRMRRAVERELADIDDPVERLRRYPDVLWSTQQQTPARAFLEVLVAARWEQGLQPGLGAALADWHQRTVSRLQEFATAHGIGNVEPLLTELRVLVSAMQGLALTSDLHEDERTVRCVLQAVTARYLEAVARVGIASDGSGGFAPDEP